MKGFTQMANIVFKLSDKDITTLMSRISFDTENLPQGMKARHQAFTLLIRFFYLEVSCEEPYKYN